MANRPWSKDERIEATFDSNDELKRKYRYLLKCTWDDQLERVTFVMLNPSIADTHICDPTLSRCVNFSKSWGYGGFNIVNLFAFISTKPEGLKGALNPIGQDNDKHIIAAAEESEKIVFAWGEKYCRLNGRDSQVIDLLKNYNLYCIKKTKKGSHPRHPLYLKSDLIPILY